MLIGTLFYYVVFVVATLIFFVVSFVQFVLVRPFDRNRKMLHWMWRLWSRAIYTLNPLWRVRVEGRENVVRGENYVVTANHCSMLDIPLLYRLPLRFKWVSKAEALKIPFFGAILWMQGDIVIRRGVAADARKMIEQGTQMLHNRFSVAIFPEGTRSHDGRIHRFKEGAFVLALNAGARVLPVVTEGTGSVSQGWKLRMPHRFNIKILPPVDISGMTPRQAADRIQKIMEKEQI
ncbi:MAG: 1-acyl-sn-glycerol-3-phosphate acyltransferase [Rikenellaceae bacterium]|jgi:1-acyl-sn-glycerol-3-phosphate acyltransferase|nr:1-acyl-sn-glycerol-3-phosphate acyltransferase [Rikenellaceae bacterium]